MSWVGSWTVGDSTSNSLGTPGIGSIQHQQELDELISVENLCRQQSQDERKGYSWCFLHTWSTFIVWPGLAIPLSPTLGRPWHSHEFEALRSWHGHTQVNNTHSLAPHKSPSLKTVIEEIQASIWGRKHGGITFAISLSASHIFLKRFIFIILFTCMRVWMPCVCQGRTYVCVCFHTIPCHFDYYSSV